MSSASHDRQGLGTSGKPGARGWGRHCFRWSVRVLVASFLSLTLAVTYVHEIGFPGWIRQPVLDQLRENSLAAEFGRLRWRFHRGLVAEDLHFRHLDETGGEELMVAEAQLELDWTQVGWGQGPAIRGVILRDGAFRIPVSPFQQTPATWLEVTNIQARLRFLSPESWELEDLQGRCLGAAFQAAGSLTNASRLRSVRPGPSTSYAWKQDLLGIIQHRDQLSIRGIPTLKLAFHFDLRHPELATADVRIEGNGFGAPWGQAGPFRADLTLNQPPGTNGTMLVAIQGGVTNLATRWAGAPIVRFDLDTAQSLAQASTGPIQWSLTATDPGSALASARSLVIRGLSSALDEGRWTTHLTMETDRPVTSWGRARSALVELTVPHGGTNTGIIRGNKTIDGRVTVSGLESLQGTSDGLTVTIVANPGPTASLPWEPGFQWENWSVQAAFRGENAIIRSLTIPSFDGGMRWQDGLVSLSQIHFPTYGEEISVDGDFRISTRELHASVAGRVQVPDLPERWTTFAGPWLDEVLWDPKHPLSFRVSAHGLFPEVKPQWTADDWMGELAPRFSLESEFQLTNVTVRGFQMRSLQVPARWNQSQWEFSSVRLEAGEGSVSLSGQADRESYQISIQSAMNPLPALKAWLPSAANSLQSFKFVEPPRLSATLQGQWADRESLVLSGHLETGVASYREEQADALTTDFSFGRGRLHAGPVWARQGTNTVNAEGIQYEVGSGLLSFTNTITTIDPVGVFAALGPRTFLSFKPFEFPLPPRVMMNGIIPTMETRTGADVRFDAEIPSFRWRFLAGTNVSASLWWHDGSIVVTNLVAGFHGGRISGNFSADIRDTNDTVLRFDAVVADSQLRSLLNDITPQTNRLEGWLDGRLTVVEAHTRTNGSWQGLGNARLRDGFLWDLPLFGGVSKVLDRAVPGLGQTRFSSGSATFVLTNRAVVTRDLELHSPTVHLYLNGSVLFDTQLDGRLEAAVLRDVPILGPIVNLVLKPVAKLLEYDVKGRLDRPEMTPRHIPGFMLAPFDALRELFPGDKSRSTNAVPIERTKTPSPVPPDPPVKPDGSQ